MHLLNYEKGIGMLRIYISGDIYSQIVLLNTSKNIHINCKKYKLKKYLSRTTRDTAQIQASQSSHTHGADWNENILLEYVIIIIMAGPWQRGGPGSHIEHWKVNRRCETFPECCQSLRKSAAISWDWDGEMVSEYFILLQFLFMIDFFLIVSYLHFGILCIIICIYSLTYFDLFY